MQHLNLNALAHDAEFWVAVSFFLFVVLAIRYIYPPIVRSLDARAIQIRDQLEKASILRAEAQALLASYQAEKEAKEKEAEAIITSAKAEAETLREKAEEELKQTLARRSQQVIEKIQRAEEEAITQIRAQMATLASQAAAEIIRTQLESGKQEDPAIERALTSIEHQIH